MNEPEPPQLEIVEDNRPERPDDSIRKISRDIYQAITVDGAWAGWNEEGGPVYGDADEPPLPGWVVADDPTELAILAGIITMSVIAAAGGAAATATAEGKAATLVAEATTAARSQNRAQRRAKDRRKRRS